jgi:tetratricopeptide (TPR) repeat protein
MQHNYAALLMSLRIATTDLPAALQSWMVVFMKSFRCLAFAVTCFIALAAAGASQHFPRLDAQAEYDKGLTAQKTGHTLAAIQAFQKAVELDPDYTEAFSALLAAAGRRSVAIKKFRRRRRWWPKAPCSSFG